MNYRHLYHAGSFADVMKHLILIILIEKIKEKPSSFTALDAFASIGIYNLNSEETSKTMEYALGANLLHKGKIKDAPNEFQIYIDIISQLNKNHTKYNSSLEIPNLYPGSSYIISQLLRENDSLIAAELHKKDYLELKSNLKSYPVHNIDAYNAIKAFLPPKTSRGFVLLDPAFEVKDEFDKIITALKLIRKRFTAGVVMIWYPIKDKKLVQKFYDDLKMTGYPEFIKIEFQIDKEELGMNKCGVVIANPPNIMDRLELIMKFLCNVIYDRESQVKSAKYDLSIERIK